MDSTTRTKAHLIKYAAIGLAALWNMYELNDAIIMASVLLFVLSWYALDFAWFKWYKAQVKDDTSTAGSRQH